MSSRPPLTLDPHDEETQSLPFEPLDPAPPPPDYEREIRRTFSQCTARPNNFTLALLDTIMGRRILLKLLAANEASIFARVVYGFTAPFLAPFQGVVNSPRARNGSTFEIPSILAILIYLLISWLIVRLLFLLLDRPTRA